jgi:hypothetical protein
MHRPTCSFWANITPFSLQEEYAAAGGTACVTHASTLSGTVEETRAACLHDEHCFGANSHGR